MLIVSVQCLLYFNHMSPLLSGWATKTARTRVCVNALFLRSLLRIKPVHIHPVHMVARTESYDPAPKPVRACAPVPASASAPSPAVAHDHAIGHIVNIREQRVDQNGQVPGSPHQSAADPLIKGDSSDFPNPAQHRKQGVFLLVALVAVSAICAGLIGPTMIGN